MDMKTAALTIALFPIVVVAASSAIVSGSTDRSPTHYADSHSAETDFDLRAGGAGSADYTATQESGFEARAWSSFDVNVETLNCQPTGMMIIVK